MYVTHSHTINNPFIYHLKSWFQAVTIVANPVPSALPLAYPLTAIRGTCDQSGQKEFPEPVIDSTRSSDCELGPSHMGSSESRYYSTPGPRTFFYKQPESKHFRRFEPLATLPLQCKCSHIQHRNQCSWLCLNNFTKIPCGSDFVHGPQFAGVT